MTKWNVSASVQSLMEQSTYYTQLVNSHSLSTKNALNVFIVDYEWDHFIHTQNTKFIIGFSNRWFSLVAVHKLSIPIASFFLVVISQLMA